MDIEQALHALATSAATRAADPPTQSLVRRVHRRRAARFTAQSVAGVGAAGAAALGIGTVLPLAAVRPAGSGPSASAPVGWATQDAPTSPLTAAPTPAPTASTELPSALPLPPSRFSGTEQALHFWDSHPDDAKEAWDACWLTVDELHWTTSGPVELQLWATQPSGGVGTDLELSTRLATTDGSALTDPQTISHIVAVDPTTGTVVGVPSEISGQSTVDAGAPANGSGVVLNGCQVSTGSARLGAGTYDIYAMQRVLSSTGDVWRAQGGPWRIALDGKTTGRLADDTAAALNRQAELDKAGAADEAAAAAEVQRQAQRDALEATLGSTAGKG